MKSTRLESQNKYFKCGPTSRIIRSLLYIYANKIVYDEISLSWSVVFCVNALPGTYTGLYAYVRTASQPIRSKNSFLIFAARSQRAATYREGRARKVGVRALEYMMKAEFQDSRYNVT